MESYVRITAMPTVDNPDEFPLYVDVVLDESNKVSGNYPVFGFQGEIGQRSGASMPFILHPDGRMDFGEKYDLPDRYYHFDLRNVGIGVEQLLKIRDDNGYEAAFRIKGLKPLA
jgi:hypothetical protein